MQTVAQPGRRSGDERRIARLKSEAEASRKKADRERNEQADASAAALRELDAEKAAAAAEGARCRRLALRAAASMLSLNLGAIVRCGAVLRAWRIYASQLIMDEHVDGLTSALTTTRLEAPLVTHRACSLMQAVLRWRMAISQMDAAQYAEEERIKAAHLTRMLQGARSQLSQRVRLPLKVEEDLTAAKSALSSEVVKAKEATTQLALAQRQLEASKSQRETLDKELRRAKHSLQLLQKEAARRAQTADESVQVGGDDGDDGGSLLANARSSAAASAAMIAAADAAPYRIGVLLRLLMGVKGSAPMRMASALALWRVRAQRRRGAREVSDWRALERGSQVSREAEVRCLSREIRLAEDAATSAAATLLHRVVGERERRQQAENALQRKEAPPLALQEELHTIKEALQLEVIAREAAEGKAQRLHRSHAALDSQLRIANESLARLMRETRRGPAARAAADGQIGGSRSPQSAGSRASDAAASGGAASIIEDATRHLVGRS